jgi:hypothetical protein
MSESKQRSEKHEAARNSLPRELVSAFDEMVGDYQHAAERFHNTPFVSHVVLAEMIRIGWRCSAEPIET